MAEDTPEPPFIQVTDRVRVESGALLRQCPKATPEALALAPARYFRGGADKFGRPIVIDEFEGDIYGPPRLDMFGKPIPNSGDLIVRGSGALKRQGQPFAYADDATIVWHIYVMLSEDEVVVDPTGRERTENITRYHRRGYEQTKEAALATAQALIAAGLPPLSDTPHIGGEA